MRINQIITDYIMKSILTDKGDMVMRGDSVPERLPAGAVGMWLRAMGADQKPIWNYDLGGMSTQGDITVKGSLRAERLAAVAVGQVLKSAGVGAKPAWGVPSIGNMNMKLVTGFRDSTGAEVVSGVGFQPAAFIFFGYDEDAGRHGLSWGVDLITSRMCIIKNTNTGYDDYSITHSITSYDDGLNSIEGVVTAVGGDGFTITWTLTGIAGCRYVCFAIG